MKKILFILILIIYQLASAQLNNLYIKANIALIHNDTNKAISILTDTLQNNPLQPYALKKLANLYQQTKQFQKSNNILLKLLEINNDSSIIFDIISNYTYLNDKINTLRWLEIYLKTSKKLPENYLRTHPLFYFLKQEKEWNNLWKKEWYTPYEKTLGEIQYLFDKKENITLLDSINNALKRYPNDITLKIWKARCLLEGNNLSEATKLLESLYKQDPLNTDIFKLLIKTYTLNTNYKKIAECYIKKYEHEPYEIIYLLHIGENMLNAEKTAEATKYLSLYIQYDTLNHKAYYLLGRSLAEKNPNKAIEYFTKALNIFDGNPEYFYERASCHYQLNNLQEAYHDMCMALDLNPSNGKYFYLRGLINYARNNSLASCRDFEQAKKLGYIKAIEYIKRYCQGK